MQKFAEIADQIAATTKKLQKTALLAEYFKSVALEEAAVAAVFFSGRPFPMWEETTLQVGGRLLWQIIAELSSKSEDELTTAYRKHGDLGAVAEVVLPDKPTSNEAYSGEQTWSDGRPRPPAASGGAGEASCSPTQVQNVFREVSAARGPAAKGVLVRELLSSVSPRESKYIVKIMTGDLRIGLKESLVEEGIAKAYEAPLAQVQRANMLLGDIGETLKLAASGGLAEAKMRLFHPIGFMLASPAESAEDALSYFQNALVEDKYDGIRAQAHCSGEAVRFFSRTRDEITESFPELPEALAGFPEDAILDGEIVAWSYLAEYAADREHAPVGTNPHAAFSRDLASGNSEVPSNLAPEGRTTLAQRGSDREAETADASPGETTGPEGHVTSFPGRALPFSALQQRLGRKKVSDKLMRDIPVAYLVFDILYLGSELLLDRPLRERAKKLDELLASPRKHIHHRDSGAQRTTAQSSLDFDAPSASSPMIDSRGPMIDQRTTYDERRTTNFPRAESQEPTAVSPPTNNQRPTTQVIRAPVFTASLPEELNQLFDAAQARGNEGLMIKDPESPYTPGRRGKSWLKLKRELATVDVVVTAVEWGHGKRIGVLSDYTFAVRDRDCLLNVGKAYSGLTDAEIADMTKWFLDHTIEDQGFRRTVEPRIVLEVAFNNVMKSARHNSGYALRFPRIVRLRPDKLPEEADTLTRVKEIYANKVNTGSKQDL